MHSTTRSLPCLEQNQTHNTQTGLHPQARALSRVSLTKTTVTRSTTESLRVPDESATRLLSQMCVSRASERLRQTAQKHVAAHSVPLLPSRSLSSRSLFERLLLWHPSSLVMADFGQTDFGQTDFGQFFDRLWPIVGLTNFGQTDFGQF